MRLLLDEMLSPAVADELAKLGHDAAAVASRADPREQPDGTVLAAARDEDRAIVTADIGGFRRLATAEAAAGRAPPPLILLHSRPWPGRNLSGAARRLVTALDALLASGAGVEGEHWLQPPD